MLSTVKPVATGMELMRSARPVDLRPQASEAKESAAWRC